MHLVYFADPLCSWCYGFGPELAQLLAREPVRLELVMGGLRPFNTERMSPAFRQMLQGHWRHVHEASGLPFSPAILEREDFVYDTEPACRAVVTARHLHAGEAFGYMKEVQAAFYRDGRDVTRPAELAQIAAQCGYDASTFAAALESPAMREATRADFARSQSLGVAGFPTLALAQGAQLFLVTSGFERAEVLAQRLDEIRRRAA